MNLSPLVLDLDGSVGLLPGEHRIPLAEWQETLRFGCSRNALKRFGLELESRLSSRSSMGTVMLGSGDFHHLSQLLIARYAKLRSDAFDVVVLDNHPDNMRFPFGTHCGSWVSSVAGMAGVSHVHVVGVTSSDVSAAHAWENRLVPLYQGRLTYWCTGVRTNWARSIGLGRAVRQFASMGQLVGAFSEWSSGSGRPIYLSIDKDVFAPDVIHTNWDQGQLLERDVHAMIRTMSGRVIGSDITGDISAYRYRTTWKRLLSRWDGQAEPGADELRQWRPAQAALDRRLVDSIGAATT